MTRRHNPYRWVVVTLSIASALLFLGGSMLQSGVVISSSTSSFSSSKAPAALTPNVHLVTALNWQDITPPLPAVVECLVLFGNPSLASMLLLGPGCFASSGPNVGAVNMANKLASAKNIEINLYNALNITNSEVANLNATFQELLSYYESRAEAIVPYFLKVPWSTELYNDIAITSGLVPSLIGVETAIAQQQYQDWNATVNGWNAAFGSAGTWAGSPPAGFNLTGGGGGATMAYDGQDLSVSPPFEYLTSLPLAGYGQNVTYLDMAPGGTIIYANVFNSSTFHVGVNDINYTITDLTQNFSFPMPIVNYTNWAAGTVPIVSTIHHIGQFDLLKVACTSSLALCTGAGYHVYETSGAYVFSLAKPVNPIGDIFFNSMVPALIVRNTITTQSAVPGSGERFTTPSPVFSVCLSVSSSTCSTAQVPTGGNSTALGSGPGSVQGGPLSLMEFAKTAQSLVNNTMTMAYDYWLTLRAITENGTYAIPPNCAIPTPSDAFPTATNFQNYRLSANNVEAVYLSYLNAIAREYGQVFTNSVGFCGQPNLGFAFNWTGSWHLLLNITASVYIGTNGTPLYLNGTPDPAETYANVATWPAYRVDPALIYPFEYQANIPVGVVYPIPINDPMIAVLVNYPGNLYYGNAAFSPRWGVPTYVSLTGSGNYIQPSGSLSSIHSGNPNASGDAIYITSCVLNGTPQNPCDISVTYFNNFTIGLVHAVIPSIPVIGGGGGLGALGNSCGFSALNQFYDGWAGYIGSAIADGFAYFGNAVGAIPIIGGGLSFLINGLGCIVAWIIVILIFAVFAYVAVRVAVSIYRGARGIRRSRSENVS